MKDRIKAVRKAAGLTQQEFAESLGLKQNTVATYEIGRLLPSDRTITDICRNYSVNETWLRTGAGEMFRPRSREDEIASFMTGLLSGEGTEFQRRLVSVLARLSTEEWTKIEQKAREILDDGTKKDPVD